MKHFDTTKERHEWKVLARTKKSNVASMVLKKKTYVGGPSNKHPADQWLLVLEGKGSATVAGREIELEAGSLVLIEANETHEIRAHEKTDLVTLNFYAPPYEE